jgi:hypothetical protein
VNTRRPGRDDVGTSDDRNPDALVLAAGAYRTEVRYPDGGPMHASVHPDDRVSLFWRVFGGTILSIMALIAISLYNHLATSISDLRGEINRVNEARAELVKKEEFNSRTQNVWERLQALQELRVTVSGLKEQLSGYADKQGDLKAVRDSLGVIEQRLKSAEEDHKALVRAELSITALEQKTAAREAQLKAAEDERKEMARHVQELRERLAKVEGVTEVKPMAKSSTQGKDG